MSELLVGLEEIARYLRCSVQSLKNQSTLLQEAGVLFTAYRGRPPRLRVCAFTDRLQIWLHSAHESSHEK
jgi:hypothetical protein